VTPIKRSQQTKLLPKGRPTPAAGARGYVLKDDIQDVIKGIQHVLEGGVYLSKQLGEGKKTDQSYMRLRGSISITNYGY